MKFLLGTLKVGLDDLSRPQDWLSDELIDTKAGVPKHGFSKGNASSRLIPMLTKNVSYSVQK